MYDHDHRFHINDRLSSAELIRTSAAAGYASLVRTAGSHNRLQPSVAAVARSLGRREDRPVRDWAPERTIDVN